MEILEELAEHDEEPGALGRHSFLLGSLVVLLVALPVFDLVSGGGTGYSMLLCLVLTAAVYVNSTTRWTFLVAALLGGGAIAGFAISEATGALGPRIVGEMLGLGLLTLTTLLMVNTLMHTHSVSQDTLVGGFCLYLLLGLCFAMGFILMTDLAPGSLEEDGVPMVRSAADPGSHAAKILYYSFVTITTLGYGDITPHGEFAQMVAVAEAIIGQLYIAIFIARLIALYVAASQARRGGRSP
jgi:hypothetical protein